MRPYTKTRLRRKFNVYGMRFQRWLGRMMPVRVGNDIANDLPMTGTIAFQRVFNSNSFIRLAVHRLTTVWHDMHRRELDDHEAEDVTPALNMR